jgi:hypothetical protein
MTYRNNTLEIEATVLSEAPGIVVLRVGAGEVTVSREHLETHWTAVR